MDMYKQLQEEEQRRSSCVYAQTPQAKTADPTHIGFSMNKNIQTLIGSAFEAKANLQTKPK